MLPSGAPSFPTRPSSVLSSSVFSCSTPAYKQLPSYASQGYLLTKSSISVAAIWSPAHPLKLRTGPNRTPPAPNYMRLQNLPKKTKTRRYWPLLHALPPGPPKLASLAVGTSARPTGWRSLYIYIWAGTPTPPPTQPDGSPPLWQGRGGFLSSQAMVYVVFIVHIVHMYR